MDSRTKDFILAGAVGAVVGAIVHHIVMGRRMRAAMMPAQAQAIPWTVPSWDANGNVISIPDPMLVGRRNSIPDVMPTYETLVAAQQGEIIYDETTGTRLTSRQADARQIPEYKHAVDASLTELVRVDQTSGVVQGARPAPKTFSMTKSGHQWSARVPAGEYILTVMFSDIEPLRAPVIAVPGQPQTIDYQAALESGVAAGLMVRR